MHRQLRFEPRSHHEQDREVDDQIEQSGQREDFNNCERLAHQAFSQAGNLENRDGRCETGLLDNDSDLVRIRRERQAKREADSAYWKRLYLDMVEREERRQREREMVYGLLIVSAIGGGVLFALKLLFHW